MSNDKVPMMWQAAFVLLARPLLKRMGVPVDMTAVYKATGVGQASALETARLILQQMVSRDPSAKQERRKARELVVKLAESQFLNAVLNYKNEHPGCYDKGERFWFSPEFKIFILEKKSEYDLDWKPVSRLLDIPVDTLKKFKRSRRDDDSDPPGPSELPDKVRKLLNGFLKTQGSRKK